MISTGARRRDRAVPVGEKTIVTGQRHTLKSAAKYAKGQRAPKGLKALLAKIEKTLDFPTERANRLVRFVEIVAAYAAGQPVTAIERQYGCTKSTVLRYARIMGLPKRPRHFEVGVRTRVLRLYRQRLPIAEIARRCGCSQAYVSRTATEAGINRRNFPKR